MTRPPWQLTQAWMQDALLHPAAVQRAQVDARLLPGAHAPASALLGVYQRSYILRLRDCLREQFPATAHALGTQLFDDMAEAYLRACPSRHPSLHHLGDRFADWIEAERPDADQAPEAREAWVDFLLDLVRYESCLAELFDAPACDLGPWPELGEDDSLWQLQPAVRVLSLCHAVQDYYPAARRGAAGSWPARQPTALALVRKDFRVMTYPLQPAHHQLLTSLQSGGDIAAALQHVAAWSGHSLFDVRRSWRADLRALWRHAGFFVRGGANA